MLSDALCLNYFRCNFHNSISTMQANIKSQSESQIAALQTVDDNLGKYGVYTFEFIHGTDAKIDVHN